MSPVYKFSNAGGFTSKQRYTSMMAGYTGGVKISKAYFYSTYNGGDRSANISVQYSWDGANWSTAFSGVADNSSSCGFLQTSGGGSDYGAYRYWRYVVGSAINGHHPRVSRITLQDITGTNYNIKVYVADNCADQGEIPGLTVSGTIAYDFLNGTNI